MSTTRIDNKLRSMRWQQLQQGVYATFSGTPDRDARLWAVVLRAGPRAALSFRTAAELHGLASDHSTLVHVTVPSNQRTRPIRGATLHYSGSIDQARHPTQLPPRTRIDETVLDMTQASASLDEAVEWICRAVGRRLTSDDRLLAALAVRPRARWRKDLCVALGDVADGGRSVLELRYIAVERGHGLPSARRQVPFEAGGRSVLLDNLYDDARLVVELDGRAYHPPEQRWADNRRDGLLATKGILTVRYSWADLIERPCEVAAEIAALLTVRGMPVTPRSCGPHCRAALTP